MNAVFRFATVLVIAAFVLPLAARARTAPAGYYKDQKVVYLNEGGLPDNATYFGRLLHMIRNHLDAVGKDHVKIRVVDLGPGVDLLQLANTDKTIAGALDSLRASGVRFLVCANTLKARKIDWHTLYGVKADDVVPSGVAELARLQGMGFAYIHI